MHRLTKEPIRGPSNGRPEVIYLCGVRSMLDTPFYELALSTIREAHPKAALLSCRDLWSSEEGWRQTYCDVLLPVTHIYIIPNPDCTVGVEIAKEAAFFWDRVPNGDRRAILQNPTRVVGIVGYGPLRNPTSGRFIRVIIKGRCNEHQTRH